MKKFNSNKGAVTVFLTLILVPTLLITSIFVDVARVYLVSSLAESAGDLSLNGLLSNYDGDLLDWYGFMGSAQSMDDKMSSSEEDFKETISSKIEDKNFNFLTSKIEGEDKIITKMEKYNLSEPEMIRKSVIDFMKYRGPIEIVERIVDKIKNSGVKDFTKFANADIFEDLREQKQKFYEKESEFSNRVYNTYLKLDEYTNKTRDYGIDTVESLGKLNDKIKEAKNVYKFAHDKLFTKYRFVDGIDGNAEALSSMTKQLKPKSHYTEIINKDNTKFNSSHVIDKATVEKVLNDLDKDFQKLKIDITNINAQLDSHTLLKTKPGTKSSDANIWKWWRTFEDITSGSQMDNIVQVANNVGQYYLTLDMYNRVKIEGDDDGTVKTRLTETFNEVKTYMSQNIYKDGSGQFVRFANNAYEITNTYKNNLDYGQEKIKYLGSETTLDKAFSDLSETLYNTKIHNEEIIKLLDVIINGEKDGFLYLNEKVASLDDLKKLAKEYEQELKQWKKEADDAWNGSTPAKPEDDPAYLDLTDDDEIKKRDAHANKDDTVIGSLSSVVTDENVQILKDRLEAIKEGFIEMNKNLDDMTYNSIELTGVNKKAVSLDVFRKNMFKNGYNNNSSKYDGLVTNSEFNTNSTELFNDLFNNDYKQLDMARFKDINKSPTLIPEKNKVNVPKIYKYAYDMFHGKNKEELEEKKKEVSDAKDKAEKKLDELINLSRFKGEPQPTVKQEFTGPGGFSAGDVFKAGFEILQNIINLDLYNIRDDLYATAYAMSMFSYATYDNEGRFKLLPKSERKGLKSQDALAKYKSKDGVWFSDELNDEVKFKNRTLTGHRISKENNAAYMAEVEYLLFGETDENASNVDKAYGTIFAMKFALNYISAMSNFWSNDVLTYVAGAIQAATAGIVPIPLTKIIVISLLTTMETWKDLDRLEVGFPVEIYKPKAEDWVYQIPSVKNLPAIINDIMNPKNDEKLDNDEGLTYSDYMTLFTALSFSGPNSARTYQRLAEVVQTNIGHKANKDDYSLKNSQVYYKLKTKLKVNPLLFTLPLFAKYTNGKIELEGWTTLDVDLIRGY